MDFIKIFTVTFTALQIIGFLKLQNSKFIPCMETLVIVVFRKHLLVRQNVLNGYNFPQFFYVNHRFSLD